MVAGVPGFIARACQMEDRVSDVSACCFYVTDGFTAAPVIACPMRRKLYLLETVCWIGPRE